MKILHINYSDKGGGAEQFASDFIAYNPESFRLLVYNKGTDNPMVIRFKQNILDKFIVFCNKVLWKFGVKKGLKQLFGFPEQLNKTYNKLRKLNEYKEADIIHLHNIHGGYFDLKALTQIASEKKIVWSLHDMWAFTGGDAFTFGNENYKKGIGYTPFKQYYPLYNPLFDRRQYYIDFKKKIYSSISSELTFVPGSTWLKKCLEESYVYDPKIKVKLIHECIDPSEFPNNSIRTWPIPRVLIINSANPFKGADIFKKALPFITKEYELFVIGSKLPITLNQKVTYLNYVEDKKGLADLFNRVDILIFPSVVENFPLTVLSAMSCGVCVLGSNIGGIPEQLADRAGEIFDVNNERDLIAKLNDLLKDLANLRQIGEKASRTVLNKYSTTNMYKEYELLYQQIKGT